MILAQLHQDEFHRRITGRGIGLKIGPYSVRLCSSLPLVKANISLLYAEYPVVQDDEFIDFHIRITKPSNIRRFYQPQAVFHFDNKIPFKPLPLSQAFPFFEWGLNWCVSQNANDYLVIHSAVMEKDGKVAILPAPPGSGKSTLCAALVHRGWRLFSDELALVSKDGKIVTPIPRPVSLKNQSIEIISQAIPEAIISKPTHDTTKGTVAHMKVPADSLEKVEVVATPKWIIFPRYEAGSNAELVAREKGETFLELADNCFNYTLLGKEGFETIASLIDGCDCYSFTYSKLEDAYSVFQDL